MLDFAGSYEKRDLHAAARLHLRSRRGLLILCVLTGVVLVLSVISSMFDGGPLLLVVSACLLVVFFGLFIWLAVWLRAERTYQTNKMLRLALEGSATSEYVEIVSAHGGGKLPWSAFYRQCQSGELVLLYQSSNLYHLFPRRFFGADPDWAEFQRLAVTNVSASPKDPLRIALVIVLVLVGLTLLVSLLWA